MICGWRSSGLRLRSHPLVIEGDGILPWQIIEAYKDKDFTFTDATSFALMGQLDITSAFAFHFDRDFSQYGFTQLTLELLESSATAQNGRVLLSSAPPRSCILLV
jgi:hypothetical protein